MTDTNRKPDALLTGLLLVATTLVVAVLEVRWAQIPTFAYDEGWHTLEARIGPAWKAFFEMSEDTHPFLYYLLLRPFAYLGTEPFYLRLLSIIPSVLSIPLLFALLRQLRIARPVALTAALVLASSWSFLHLGTTIRSYSLAVFLLLGALWFWTRMLPGGRPSRFTAVMSLGLFSAAFWCLYSAGFATTAIFGATLLAMAVNADTRRALIGTWRQHSGWPEWLAFFVAHIAAVLWFKVGWLNHVGTSAPVYLEQFTLSADQGVIEFLIGAMRAEMDLLTPLFHTRNFQLPIWAQDAGALLVLGTASWLSLHHLRQRQVALAVVAMTPLLMMAILMVLALGGKYPFGGELRHQYVLFPFLLLLLPLAMNVLWQRLPNAALKGTAMAIVLAVAATTSVRAYQDHGGITEARSGINFWQDEFDHVFATASEAPVFIPGFPFYPAYINRLEPGMWYRNAYKQGTDRIHQSYQGWLAILLPWPEYQEYGANTDDGGETVFVKDHYRMMFGAVPDDWFFTQMRGVLNAMGKTSARVLAPEVGKQPDHDEPLLRAAAARAGFVLTHFERIDDALFWSVDVAPDNTAAADPACVRTP